MPARTFHSKKGGVKLYLRHDSHKVTEGISLQAQELQKNEHIYIYMRPWCLNSLYVLGEKKCSSTTKKEPNIPEWLQVFI